MIYLSDTYKTVAAVSAIIAGALLLLISILYISRIKKCPADKIMVITGVRDSKGRPVSFKCIHGGAAFIYPFVQSYSYLDLAPISIGLDIKRARTKEKTHVNVLARFTVGISTEHEVMQNAAERLLGLRTEEIKALAEDIICGQLRLVVAETVFEQIDDNRDKFLEEISAKTERELRKIGLRLININIADVFEQD